MRSGSRAFTLLEVVVALSILSISLMVLLESQGLSLQNATRSRDISVASLLARSKMIDVEQRLFHEGFTMGEHEESGTFADEGYPDVHWQTHVSEIELDLTNLLGMCEGLAEKHGKAGKDGKSPSDDCSSSMQMIGASAGGLLSELSRSMRAAEVVVRWPVGRNEESMRVRALLTQDDFQTLAAGEASKNAERIQALTGAGGSSLPTDLAVPR